MTLNLKKLTEQLEISDRGLGDLKNQVVESFDDDKKMHAILSGQCQNREETHCLSCDDEGDCFILNGIMYLELDDTNNAIKELENAYQHLRSKDETWNCICSLVLLGVAYEKCQKRHQALREYKKAHDILTNNYLRVHANDYIEKARLLENELQNILKQLSSQGLSVGDHTKTDDSIPVNSNPTGNDDKDYLALFSLPVYDAVTAGPDGIIQIHPFGSAFTAVREVEIENENFQLHVIKKTSHIDHQITIQPQLQYGWATVRGNSMNGWEEISFNEGDYVLFYKTSVATHRDYVIASNRDPSGELAPIVKRFDANKNLLLSNSADTSETYPPILLDEEHQIIGVVIAVAKPVK